MNERIILALIVLSPMLVMAGMWLVHRWFTQPTNRVVKEIIAAALIFGATGYWLVSSGLGKNGAYLRFQRQEWLFAVIPMFALILFLQQRTLSGISRGRMWLSFLLRTSIMILLLMALAGLQMVIEQDTLSVLYVLDVSKSVPESERQRALDFIKKTIPAKKPDDKAGLLVFGGRAEWEVSPTPLFSAPNAREIKASPATDATNIETALQRAVSRSDDDARRRIVLFTDGRQTAGDATKALQDMAGVSGIDVWVVPLKRGNDAEMLIEKVVLPNELLWEQPFDAHVFVYSNVSAPARVTLFTGDRVGGNPPAQTVNLVPGKNRVTFPGLKMHSGGAKEVRAVIEPLNRADDTLSENNEAFAFTDVQTENRVLILTSDVAEVKHLLAALEGEKMTLDVRAGTSLPDNPEAYRGYDCIVLANLARSYLSEQQMKVIETCVKDQGAGLIMIGGDQSFGAGGYLNTPIEDALPVQMDLKNQRVMPSGALCIVLHTCEFADGNAWGKKISKAALKTLSPQDFAGLIYYGNLGGEQWCFKPAPVRPQMFQLIDGCDPGDMPSLDKIVDMANTALANLSNVSLKHCIVITDGDPSPPTATTLAAAKRNHITVSVITIFPHGGANVSTMKDVAAQTGGRYYSADDPRKLPQIFIKEAAVVRKSLIRSDDKGIPISLSVTGPTLKEFGNKFPDINAFVVTAPKDRAELQLFTTVEGEKLPILMSWHYGLGKAVAFTSDCTNRWAKNWVEWQSYKKFWTNMLTWASRQRVPSNHTVSTRIEGDTAHVVLESLDAQGNYLNFAKLTGNAIDPEVARNNADGKTFDLTFTMTAPGRYEATFPVQKAGAYAVTIVDQSDPKKPNTIVTGLANSYSAEFLHLDADDVLLAKMGDIATGKNKVSRLKDLSKLDPVKCGVFNHDLPPSSQPTDLFLRLLIAALCLFPLDVAVRRIAIDPEKGLVAIWAWMQPALIAMRLKKQQIQDAAAEAIAGKPAAPQPPPDIVPTGEQSRAAQSKFEQAGASADFDLKPSATGTDKPVVGGTKLTPADEAASDYTRALLKAKKRAKKDE